MSSNPQQKKQPNRKFPCSTSSPASYVQARPKWHTSAPTVPNSTVNPASNSGSGKVTTNAQIARALSTRQPSSTATS